MIHLQRMVIVVVVASLGWVLPTLFFDDAYISFRYAANIAAGQGFTWNPPERVLGTTTPLYTLVLSGAARLGFDLESAAWMLGIAGQVLMCLLVFETMRWMRAGQAPPSFPLPLLGAVLCAVHPHLALTAMGGMETPLYVGLLLAVLLAAAEGAAAWTGILAGLALLTRPDAVLVFLPAAWLLAHGGSGGSRMHDSRGGAAPRDPDPGPAPGGARPGRGPVRALMLAAAWCAAVAGPWLIFATMYFGSPVPHSIAAKRLIHPFGPLQVLGEFGGFLWDDWLLLAAIPLAVWGLERRRGTRLAPAIGVFCLLYLITYIFSGVTPFPWYVNPLLPPVLMLGLIGLDDLLGRLNFARDVLWTGASVIILGIAIWQLRDQAPDLRDAWDAWEGQYEVAGRWILNDSKPGDRVLVGEVGVIGYLLPGRVVLDSSGINSPEIYRLRQGHGETDPQWSRDVIEKLDPDYITTSVSYLNIRTVSEEPWFTRKYRMVPLPLLEREGQFLFKRQ